MVDMIDYELYAHTSKPVSEQTLFEREREKVRGCSRQAFKVAPSRTLTLPRSFFGPVVVVAAGRLLVL
jgi:hypothetical protein